MWKVKIGLTIVWLLVGAGIDIKKREIPMWYVLLGVLGGLFCCVAENKMLSEKMMGLVAGVCFLLASYLTCERIGYGDSIVISVLGITLGIWQLLEVLSVTFVLLGIFAGYCFVRKKWVKMLPFLPFLAAGYIGVLCI